MRFNDKKRTAGGKVTKFPNTARRPEAKKRNRYKGPKEAVTPRGCSNARSFKTLMEVGYRDAANIQVCYTTRTEQVGSFELLMKKRGEKTLQKVGKKNTNLLERWDQNL